jgi:two-component system sensor histidine kinase/response regulator
MNRRNRSTILIIEDDEAVRQTLVDMLALNGFQTATASDGTAGFAAAKSQTPALIITDIEMPGMTGFELLEQFGRDELLRTIPVIVISAKIDRAATRRGMELGASDFITKPFTEDEVIHSITTRLEKKELLDELDAFAHTVAHDLKNPLATLCGRIDLLGMMLGKSDEATLRNHLTEAANSARRLVSIIDELLTLAGVRRQAVVPRFLDMTAIVTESIDRLESLLQRQHAVVRRPDLWPAAIGHAPWVIEVWVNFISNAAKYGGTDPLITLGGETNADGRSARFWVQDAGPGLDEAAQARMFVPFTSITTVRAQGHGLGLSIVRRIVEKLGGKVGVESQPGAGARFWFEVPSHLPVPNGVAPSAPPLLFLP